MKILAIETSCDETAIALIQTDKNLLGNKGGVFEVLGNVVLSQVKLHAAYGGVFPSLAKREHAKNLIPLLKQVLNESGCLKSKVKNQKSKSQVKIQNDIEEIFAREPDLMEQFGEFIPMVEKPDIDAVAVTYGPGLEPALWVGINFAKALATAWDVPIVPVNHMEGHLFSALLKAEKRISNFQFPTSKQIPNNKLEKQNLHRYENLEFTTYNLQQFEFPILALLISGGHTELVLMRDWFQYEIVGETKDDAVGEAFDKVARMLGLGYPGGPEVARQAAQFQPATTNRQQTTRLPRPMLDSGDFNFSFSGLKTAVLYALKKTPELAPELIQEFAYEFQEAVTDVLVTKTINAAHHYGTKTILVGGGVSANQRLRNALTEETNSKARETKVLFAPMGLTCDNALMIAVAGALRFENVPESIITDLSTLNADGTARIDGEPRMDIA